MSCIFRFEIIQFSLYCHRINLEDVFNFFNEALHKYNIIYFIEKVDPSSFLNFSWVDENCECFLNYMNDQQWKPYNVKAIKHTMKIVNAVNNFVGILNKYCNYLALNMKSIDYRDPDVAVPKNRDPIFTRRVYKYRRILCRLLQRISKLALCDTSDTVK